jgi:hypothetical protein
MPGEEGKTWGAVWCGLRIPARLRERAGGGAGRIRGERLSE